MKHQVFVSFLDELAKIAAAIPLEPALPGRWTRMIGDTRKKMKWDKSLFTLAGIAEQAAKDEGVYAGHARRAALKAKKGP